MTLLLIIKRNFELSEELPGDVALEAALDVTIAVLLGSTAFGIGLRVPNSRPGMLSRNYALG